MERALSDGGSLPYDPMSQYELSVPYETSFIEEWESFEHGVKHSGRFYLDRQREYIERIFRPLLNGELHRGKPPIIEIGAEGSDIQFIYRARAANTAAEQKRIFENPPRELAPPPATLRTAGRMNAAGVVAFYGATDATTCIAELAIPFGGAAVVGKFKCLRPLRVLDFRLLRSARMQYSYFDPTLTERLGYQHFMQSLRNLLRRPVLPGHEDLDYLPTQMIAEFLAHEGLDGAMFISSVTPEASDEAQYELAPDASAKDLRPAGVAGINIVVFSHAAGVVNDMGPPRRRVIRVHPPVEMEPPFDGWLYVEIGKGAPPEDPDPLPYPEYDDANEPTLELMEDEIVLAYPKKIEYSIVSMAPTFAVPEDDALTPF
ncbi:MAG: RES family NAD+ phosphorylase [Vulcanimicrobiaceae bacterium]